MIENEDELLSQFVMKYVTAQYVIARSAAVDENDDFVTNLVEKISNINMPVLMTSTGLMQASRLVFEGGNNQDFILNMYEYFKLAFRYDEEAETVKGLNHANIALRIRKSVCYSPPTETIGRIEFNYSNQVVSLFPDETIDAINELNQEEKAKAFDANARWLIPIILIKMFSEDLMAMIIESKSPNPRGI